MTRVPGCQVFTQKLDHLGLVAGILKELASAERINALLGEDAFATEFVSVGDCVAAMILNGLGFSNQALYLVSRFFQNKPIQRLINPDVKEEGNLSIMTPLVRH